MQSDVCVLKCMRVVAWFAQRLQVLHLSPALIAVADFDLRVLSHSHVQPSGNLRQLRLGLSLTSDGGWMVNLGQGVSLQNKRRRLGIAQ